MNKVNYLHVMTEEEVEIYHGQIDEWWNNQSWSMKGVLMESAIKQNAQQEYDSKEAVRKDMARIMDEKMGRTGEEIDKGMGVVTPSSPEKWAEYHHKKVTDSVTITNAPDDDIVYDYVAETAGEPYGMFDEPEIDLENYPLAELPVKKEFRTQANDAVKWQDER